MLGRALRPPRHPLRLARFGLPGAPPATAGSRSLPHATRRGRCSPASPRTRCCRSTGRPPPRSGSCCSTLGHAVGWPVAGGGSQAIADALAGVPARRSAARSTPASRCARWTSCRRRGRCCFDLTPRQVARDRAATRCPAATPRAAPLPLRPRRLQGRLGARRAGPWTRRGAPAGRHGAPRRHARARSPPPRRDVAAGAHPERPFVLVGQQSLVDPTRAPAGQAHAVGVLPRAQRLDGRHDRRDRGARSSASPPASATCVLGAATRRRRPSSRRTTRTTSAATSTAAPRTCAQLLVRPGRCGSRRTRRRTRASSCARRRRRRAAASTGCAATTPPARRCAPRFGRFAPMEELDRRAVEWLSGLHWPVVTPVMKGLTYIGAGGNRLDRHRPGPRVPAAAAAGAGRRGGHDHRVVASTPS